MFSTTFDKDYFGARDIKRVICSALKDTLLYGKKLRCDHAKVLKLVYEEGALNMKWPGKNFHLVNGNQWMCNICGLNANTGSGAMLRRNVRDEHTVEVCASKMALPTEKVNASNMAQKMDLNIMVYL